MRSPDQSDNLIKTVEYFDFPYIFMHPCYINRDAMFRLKHGKLLGKAAGEKKCFESKLFLVSLKTAHLQKS